MINTKLIFVDGISGSGKSTTAHFIARQLEKNGIKAKWFYEQEINHPFVFDSEMNDEELKKEENKEKFLIEYRSKFCAQIEKFIDSIKDDEYTYIVEGLFFQDLLWPFVQQDCDLKIIEEFYDRYYISIEKLNPVVIHFYHHDTDFVQRRNWQIRGESWKEQVIQYIEKFYFCKKRNISGEEAYLTFWKTIADISRYLFDKLTFPKLQIESTAHDWNNYRKQIATFLDIQLFEEKFFDNSFEKYCGYYSGLTIHVKDNRLCMDDFWPNLKLIPLGNDEFEMEAFPVSLKFNRDENNVYSSIIITKALDLYKEGDVRNKLQIIDLNEEELSKFCGNYWSESQQLDRKIYLKEGKLYYWRGENNETRLMPVSQNQLAMHRASAMLEYELVDGVKQILFKEEGQADFTFKSYEASEK